MLNVSFVSEIVSEFIRFSEFFLFGTVSSAAQTGLTSQQIGWNVVFEIGFFKNRQHNVDFLVYDVYEC